MQKIVESNSSASLLYSLLHGWRFNRDVSMILNQLSTFLSKDCFQAAFLIILDSGFKMANLIIRLLLSL